MSKPDAIRPAATSPELADHRFFNRSTMSFDTLGEPVARWRLDEPGGCAGCPPRGPGVGGGDVREARDRPVDRPVFRLSPPYDGRDWGNDLDAGGDGRGEGLVVSVVAAASGLVLGVMAVLAIVTVGFLIAGAMH